MSFLCCTALNITRHKCITLYSTDETFVSLHIPAQKCYCTALSFSLFGQLVLLECLIIYWTLEHKEDTKVISGPYLLY